MVWNANENITSKTALWTDRIHAFLESSLSRKDWCQQNEIPPSTLSYWIRKIQSEDAEPGGVPAPVFARLPIEPELDVPIHTGIPTVTILLPEKIRIEVGPDFPARLMAALLQALKGHA